MSTQLPTPIADSTSLEVAIDDLCGVHNDVTKFFGDAFDQLESLSLELFARHKCLELNAQHQVENDAAGAAHEHQFRECMEAMQDLKATVCSAQKEAATMWSELSTKQQQSLQEHAEDRKNQEELRRVGTEFRVLCDGLEQQRVESRRSQENIEEYLKRMASKLAESAAMQSHSGSDEQLAQVLETARQQQSAWQQERARLEAELAAERQRAAQQSEALAEQRRVAAEQQAELAGELKRMRSLLELLLNHMNQPIGGATNHGKQASSSSENAALESMLSQFEMLQRDLAERRAGGQKDLTKAQLAR